MLRSSATETWKPSTKQLRAAASNAAQLDTSAWDLVSAVTLTLKQALWSEGCRIFADEHQCTRAFRHFMNLLNRAIYGSAFRRSKKRLRVIPVLRRIKTVGFTITRRLSSSHASSHRGFRHSFGIAGHERIGDTTVPRLSSARIRAG